MAIQRLSAALPALADQVSLASNLQPSWSPGAAMKVPISVLTDLALGQPKPTLLSMTITITHAIEGSKNVVGIGMEPIDIYGKLGRVIGGLEFGSAPQDPSTSTQFTPPIGDRDLIGDIWNPEADPLPQHQSIATGRPPTTAPIWSSESITITPPFPLQLDPSSLPVAGVWIFPSLIGTSSTANFQSFSHTIATANYSLTYDDGL